MSLKRRIHRLKPYAPSDLHCSRFYRYRELGMSPDDIAREDGVAATAVRVSIGLVQAYRAKFSTQEVLASQAKIVIECAELEQIAIQKALTATTKVDVTDKNGEVKTIDVDDHATQLQASEILTRKTEVIQPKIVKGISVNTNVGVVSQNAGPVAPPRGFTIEERLRELQAKRQGLLPESTQERSFVQPSPVEAFDAEAELLHDEG